MESFELGGGDGGVVYGALYEGVGGMLLILLVFLYRFMLTRFAVDSQRSAGLAGRYTSCSARPQGTCLS